MTPPPSRTDEKPASVSTDSALEAIYLKFFKYTVVALMTIALATIAVLIPLAAINFMQSPTPPEPAKKAPTQTINIEDLKNFLIQEEKKRQDAIKNGGKPEQENNVPTKSVSLQYMEQVLKLYRCSSQFATSTGVNIDLPDAEIARNNESLRSNIEQRAAHPLLRDAWVNAMTEFGCAVFSDPTVIQLKLESKIGSVFIPLIRFHAAAWQRIEQAKLDFDNAEKNRIANQMADEIARVGEAKLKATMFFSIAAGAFGFFLFMALYLIFARIEGNLRLIYQSINQATIAPSFPPTADRLEKRGVDDETVVLL
jgi:hypothetical protein